MPKTTPANGEFTSPWTAELVKEHLPDVMVLDEDGKKHTAIVRGRLLPFAGVNFDNGRNIEVAWATIARVLNNGGAVRC